MANLLLENAADIGLQDSNRQTALHLACIKGDLEIYKCLVAKNPFAKNAVDKNSSTPLDLALKNHHKKIIDYDKK